MTPPIIIFYHCVFLIEGRPLLAARSIVSEQMLQLKQSGLYDEANEFNVGINGDGVSAAYARDIIPAANNMVFHGNQCRNELRTLLMIEEWCKVNTQEAYILYFHSKGASHPPDSDYAKLMSTPWRRRMMYHCVTEWRTCVRDLMRHQAVGAHWLTGQGSDKSQHYFAGSFWWCRASFFRTIPSVMTRQRIKDSGVDSYESRFEPEVHLGNGPKLPVVKDYYNGRIGS